MARKILLNLKTEYQRKLTSYFWSYASYLMYNKYRFIFYHLIMSFISADLFYFFLLNYYLFQENFDHFLYSFSLLIGVIQQFISCIVYLNIIRAINIHFLQLKEFICHFINYLNSNFILFDLLLQIYCLMDSCMNVKDSLNYQFHRIFLLLLQLVPFLFLIYLALAKSVIFAITKYIFSLKEILTFSELPSILIQESSYYSVKENVQINFHHYCLSVNQPFICYQNSYFKYLYYCLVFYHFIECYHSIIILQCVNFLFDYHSQNLIFLKKKVNKLKCMYMNYHFNSCFLIAAIILILFLFHQSLKELGDHFKYLISHYVC